MSTATTDVERTMDGLTRLFRTASVTKGGRAAAFLTRDRELAITTVERAAETVEAPLHHITPNGVRVYDRESWTWKSARTGDLTPQQMLDEAHTRGGIVILEEFVRQIEDGSPFVQARALLSEILARRSIGAHGLVLIMLEAPETEARIPALIQGQVARFTLGLPRADELERMVKKETANFAGSARARLSPETIRGAAPRLAHCLAGLTHKGARDLLHDALAADLNDLDQAASFLSKKKSERLSRELSMEVLEGGQVELPLGVPALLEHIRILKPRMRVYGKDRARGVLIVGPPGTGKTMLARALGAETELPVVVFKISSLMNSWLGETERLFARAFATLEAMSPCIVFIDEIEKAFGDSGERDGGTMMRVSGALLSWLSDNPYPTFIVATCNSLTRMGEIGAAMTRSERFDAAYFLDVPTAMTRAAILSRLLAGQVPASKQALEELAAETEHFSGADLTSVVKAAGARAEYAKTPLTISHVREQIAKKRPRAQALYGQFEGLRSWGAANCEPADPGDLS